MRDVALDAATFALRALAVRQRASADNVANASTPGYLARQVEFEDSLRAALRGGDLRSAAVTEHRSLAATTPNGNNVDLVAHLTGTTGMHYSLMLEVVSYKFRLLRTAAR